MKNLQVRLASRPSGWPTESNFALVESEVPAPGEGQLVVRVVWLSLDPYMRGRMNDAKSYAPKVELDEVMVGATVGEVVASRHPAFAAGDFVVGGFGWQQLALSDGRGVMKVATPSPIYLGPVGMPGVTAWIGLHDLGQPKRGETVVVSAAAGAVGSVVGQLARLAGCRAVGVAGGERKCRHVVEELGFDACVDYRGGRLREELRAAAPDGIDIYFENVGGEVLDEVARLLNPFARIPLCGLISEYNEQPRGFFQLMTLLVKRVKLQGFIVSDHMERWPAALAELERLERDGKLRHRETIVDGLENAPRAFLGLLRGENLGKMLVRVSGGSP
jgi:NADPH-dependent curcumin reductase CurA